ncbi:MAG: HEAT repeat domain-containing protein [Elusimicrobiota bacterium]
MITPLVLLAASLAAGQTTPASEVFAPEPAPAAQSAPPLGGVSVGLLKERFVEAIDEPTRVKILDQIAITRPVSAQDVSALFDMFSRYSDPGLRKKVMESLARVDPSSPQLEPLFISYLNQPEPETQLFGINGAFHLRSRQGLPLVRKIAERKFQAADASSITLLSQRNAWWTQFEALSALAQWQGEKVLPLLRSKADESSAVARLLGRFFWRQTFPDLKAWSESSDANVREKAVEAAGAQIEPSEARATRDGMLDIVRDQKADEEVRHRLALKVGACSTDAEVESLIAEHDKAKEDKMKLLLMAAIAYSRSPKAIPLLVRYARDSEDEIMRKGARAQLVDMVGEEQTKSLIGDKKDVIK